MSHAIEFIETPIFTRQIKAIATDEELRKLQVELIAQPTRGDVIQGTGGLRKIRLAIGHQGKSGGARVIYFIATKERIYFLLAYIKQQKDNLSEQEKLMLKKLAEQLQHEAKQNDNVR